MSKPRLARVKCPTCRREIEWSDASPHRPFCSDRCRLMDLGAWISEQRGIPGDVGPGDGAPDDADSPPPDGETRGT